MGIGHSADGFNGAQDPGGSTWAYRIQGTSIGTGTPWAGTPAGYTTSVTPPLGSRTTFGAAGVAGVDYFSTALDSVPWTASTTGTIDFDIDPSLIHTWVTGTNAGMLMRATGDRTSGDGGTTNRLNFFASEASTISTRPQLIVTLVPEPGRALLGVLGLGALCLRRRRGR